MCVCVCVCAHLAAYKVRGRGVVAVRPNIVLWYFPGVSDVVNKVV